MNYQAFFFYTKLILFSYQKLVYNLILIYLFYFSLQLNAYFFKKSKHIFFSVYFYFITSKFNILYFFFLIVSTTYPTTILKTSTCISSCCFIRCFGTFIVYFLGLRINCSTIRFISIWTAVFMECD